MKFITKKRPLQARFKGGFTLLEMLVAVSVMTLVIYVLYALFDQTQDALKKNASEVDVNEGKILAEHDAEEFVPPKITKS